MADIATVIHLLDEARGFAALSPAGRENISEAIDILETLNTRTAAPVEGLETVGATYMGYFYKVSGKAVWPVNAQELVTRSQAEAIIAAKDADIDQAIIEKWDMEERAEKAEANNEALTARVKELSDLIDGENCADTDKIDALFRRAETAETQLTAAKDALEIVANAHASNPSLAMADVPEADYVRHVLYEMRKLARAALEDRS